MRRIAPPPISAPGRTNSKKPKKTHSILVSLKDKKGNVTEDAEAVKKALMGAINPAAEKIRVRNIRKTRNGKVLVETETQNDLDKIKDHTGLQDKGIVISTPASRVPRVIIYDVPKDLPADSLPKAILEQNPELLKDMGVEEFQKQCEFRFKLGPRDRETTNWVAEVSPAVRNLLRTKGKLFLEWRSCKILDFISLSRCFKCQGVGHIAAHCKASKETCGHCAEEGHKKSGCPNLSKAPTCVLCKRRGKPTDHATQDKECPSFKAALENFKGSIDYGG